MMLLKRVMRLQVIRDTNKLSTDTIWKYFERQCLIKWDMVIFRADKNKCAIKAIDNDPFEFTNRTAIRLKNI